MRPVDEYIVRMALENEELKRKSQESIGIFEKLKGVFSKDVSTNSLESMATGIDNLVSKFDTSSVIFRQVLGNMVDAAMRAGKQLAGAIMDPLVESGKQRALNIEQAKFQFEGLGMDVEKSMESANNAVLGTAFGLDEAAMAAAMFGASGMEAGEEMTTSLRAISGVAAMTGSSYSDMANIFTSVAGNGRVMGNDLLRLSVRGVNAAAILGKAMNKTEQEVREMVTKGQIDFETFAKAMDDAFGEHATKASETYAGSVSLVRSALARIGETLFASGFVDKKNIFNAITPQINEVHAAIKPLAKAFNDYKTLVTGRFIANVEKLNLKPLTQSTNEFVKQGGMKNIIRTFEALGGVANTVLSSIRNAWSRVFSAPSMDQSIGWLDMIASAFEKFESFISKNADNITSVFQGMFAIIDAGWFVFKEFAKVLIDAFPTSLSGSILDTAGGFGELAIAFAETVKEGNVLPAVLENISKVMSGIGKVTEFVSGVFSKALGFIKPVLSFIIDGFAKLTPIIGEFVGKVLNTNVGFRNSVFGMFTTTGLIAGLTKFAKILPKLASSASGVFDSIGGFFSGLGSISKNINDLLKGLTSGLKALTDNVKAKTLVLIAGAVGILAVSLKILQDVNLKETATGLGGLLGIVMILTKAMDGFSKIKLGRKNPSTQLLIMAASLAIMASALKKLSDIKPAELATGLLGVAGAMGILVAATKALSGVKGMKTGAIKMIAMATAIKIITSSLIKLSELEMGDIATGLVGLGGILLEVGLFSKLMDGVKVKATTAVSIGIISLALHSLVKVVKSISELSLKDMAKGLGGIGVLLAEIVGFSHLINPIGMINISISMGLIAGALRTMVGPVSELGSMDMKSLAKGLGSIAILLAEVIGFSHLVNPVGLLPASFAMTVMAAAIGGMVTPLRELGNMSLRSLAKGLGGIAVMLGELVLAMNLSTAGIPGAIAITIMAGALNLLVWPIKTIGSLPLMQVVKGVAGLGIAMVGLGAAASVVGLMAPLILAFGGALLLLGTAIRTTGHGIYWVGRGLVSMANAAKALGGLPVAALDLFSEAFGIMLDIIIDNVPKMVDFIGDMLMGFMERLTTDLPKSFGMLADAVIEILGILEEKLPRFIEFGINAVMAVLKGIEENAERLALQGADTMIALINAMTAAIEEKGPELKKAIKELLGEILIFIIETIAEIGEAIFKDIPIVRDAFTDMAEAATNAVRDTLGLPEVAEESTGQFVQEIQKGEKPSYDAGAQIAQAGKDGANSMHNRWNEEGGRAGGSYISGIQSKGESTYTAGRTAANRGRSGSASVSFWDTGNNATGGFIGGMTRGTAFGGLWSAGVSLASQALGAVKSALRTQSPSRETMAIGEFFTEGLSIGISGKVSEVYSSAKSVGERAIEAVRSQAQVFSDALDGEFDLQPTIRPVVDMGDFNFDPDDFDGPAYTASRIRERQSMDHERNQNGYNSLSDTGGGSGGGVTNNYDIHIHAQGSLPKSTIDRMAKDFDNAIKRMNDRGSMGRGEDVVF